MKVWRELLAFLMMVGILVVCMSTILKETSLYTEAYRLLGRFMTNPSIEVWNEE